MKTTNRFLALALVAAIALLACSSPTGSEPPALNDLTIANILGITPVTGEKPVTTIDTAQFSGVITWEPEVSDTFEPLTVYTATIILKLESGFTLEGIPADFFTVNDSETVSFTKASATITAVFPATGGTADNPVPVSVFAIRGVTAPVTGALPVAAITATTQYTGNVTWAPDVQGAFAELTVYTATITLTPRTGFTLEGVAANAFTVAGAAATNDADSGVVSAVFPATGGTATDPVKVTIAAIQGVTAPAFGEGPVSAITPTLQFVGTVTWTPAVSGTFAAATTYTAKITLTAINGFTFQGVAANFFTVAGATATNAAGSGVVTAVFPATAAPSAVPVNIAEILGVTAPVTGATPVNTITATEEYTGTVSWAPSVSGTFAASTPYTATITLSAKSGFTFAGVAADFFTVAGAAAANAAGSGVITAVFPTTGGTVSDPVKVSIAAIPGVTAPVTGAAPVASVDSLQYTGSVTWDPPVSGTFAASTVYTATITLTALGGFTFQGVAANFFTVAGATSVSNAANSGEIIAVFPATATIVDITNISGVTAPVMGAVKVTTITATTQYTGIVTWTPSVSSTFAASTSYTATITLTALSGFTFQGVAANSFAVAGATVSNAANTGIVTAVFPATGNITIPSVAITVMSPVAGAAPNTGAMGSGSYNSNYSISTVAWSPDHNPFQNAEEYTATLTLTANTGYSFSLSATATINGSPAAIVSNDGSVLTISRQFPPTVAANDGIGVNFIGGPVDEVFDLTKSHDNDLSLTEGNQLTITVAGDFDYYQYYYNGYYWTFSYNSYISIAGYYFGNEPGRTYKFTIVCWKGLPSENGVPYSKEVTYRVVW